MTDQQSIGIVLGLLLAILGGMVYVSLPKDDE